MAERSGGIGAVGQSLDGRPRLTHDVKWVGGMGLIGLAALLLISPPVGGHVATAVEPREPAPSASSGNPSAQSRPAPSGPSHPRRIATEAPAGDGVLAPRATMLACAADITSAGSTIDYWTSALKDKDPHVRSLAAAALGETRNAAAVPALIEALKDEDEEVRLLAVQALGRIGREAKAAVPALMMTLKDTRPNISAEAARTLEKVRQQQ